METQEVTCLCPTFGRFTLLCEAVACFLAQRYPAKRLLIVNDAPEPLATEVPGVKIINVRPLFQSLGDKRQFMLEAAETPLVAHCDDDDLYLPWHLSGCVATLAKHHVGCTKVARSILHLPASGKWKWKGSGNDGSMVFDREQALELGGYARRQVGQSMSLLRRFGKRRWFAPTKQKVPSVVVCRHVGHNSKVRSGAIFRKENADFAGGREVIPADVDEVWGRVVRGTRKMFGGKKQNALTRRLYGQ